MELLCSGIKMLFKNEQYFCITISSLQFLDFTAAWGPLPCCSHSYSKFLKCHSTVHKRRCPRFLLYCLLGHFCQVTYCSFTDWRAFSLQLFIEKKLTGNSLLCFSLSSCGGPLKIMRGAEADRRWGEAECWDCSALWREGWRQILLPKHSIWHILEDSG